MTEPDRIVGELLQPGGYLKLIELGLEGTAAVARSNIIINSILSAKYLYGWLGPKLLFAGKVWCAHRILY